MKTKKVIEAAHRLSKPYRIRNGKEFRLKDVNPGDTGELKSEDKPPAREALQTGVGALAKRIRISPDLAGKVYDMLTPGATIIVTDDPAVRKASRDFTILAD